ncbi:hypothetical protein [Ammoniphilus sp. 3BR4]|uniref:hypothetical protein n=1 Tax=Ammoniphilus sp. 3BR4 TaxID=3158265 RepID=UPI003466DD02
MKKRDWGLIATIISAVIALLAYLNDVNILEKIERVISGQNTPNQELNNGNPNDNTKVEPVKDTNKGKVLPPNQSHKVVEDTTIEEGMAFTYERLIISFKMNYEERQTTFKIGAVDSEEKTYSDINTGQSIPYSYKGTNYYVIIKQIRHNSVGAGIIKIDIYK